MFSALGNGTRPSNGKTRIIDGVVVDYTAGLTTRSVRLVDISVMPSFLTMYDASVHSDKKNAANVAPEDSLDHQSRTVEFLFNAHMATEIRAGLVAKFCVSASVTEAELEAVLLGVDAMAAGLRQGYEKRKIREDVTARVESEIAKKKRKFDDELAEFSKEKRHQGELEIAEKLDEKLKKNEAKKAMIEKLEKSLEEEP